MPGKKRIRLFIDAHCFDQEYQGSRTFLEGIYRSLIRNPDIHFFFGVSGVQQLSRIFGEADNITYLEYRSRSGPVRLAWEIPRMISRHGIDVAHFQYILPLIRNCRQIATIHDVIFREDPRSFSRGYRLLKNFLYKRSAHMADHITTVSAHSKQSIIDHLGVDSEKITVVPNAVDRRFFADYDLPAAREFIREKFGIGKFILCVSRFEPRKNQLLLVEACLRLGLFQQGYHLVLPGHTSLETPELDRLLERLDPATRKLIFIDSHISNEDLLQFYRAAEVFVYPSQAEGFGIPPLEAAAACVPVICSDRSAMKDFTFFGAGHLDPLVPGLLDARLGEVLAAGRDPGELRSIANIVKKKYDWDISAGIFQTLISNHSTVNNDQFSKVRGKQERLETELPVGEAVFTPGDR
ncbi:MAG TPA: glycosyltransferase family 1 protein [Chitinophagaceae bacterium]|nr:glycosyltransferase family 1 protein [Chitinophagaceae bacterium]